MSDAAALGGKPEVAWLVDTFGHISQAPQMLALAGLDAAFVWRGVPVMAPHFSWESPDGTQITTIDLFGGYRNLYGVTKTADIALERLVAEVDKLAPAYGDIPIPLFDGYDLDTEPEDPILHYAGQPVPEVIELVASSPETYVDAVRKFADAGPTLQGELLSGKYGATFPGSLSARTYLKVLHSDAEWALHRRLEPLAVLAAARGVRYEAEEYESAARELLQNGVHDCICGVSIDQVHERMERSYRRLLRWANDRQAELTTHVLAGFPPGTYAVSTNPMPTSSVVRTEAESWRVRTDGIGVAKVLERHRVRPLSHEIDEFRWVNDHYAARIDGTRLSLDGAAEMLRFVVRAETGDTYSSEPGPVLGVLEHGPLVHVDETDVDATVRFEADLELDEVVVRAAVSLRFDDGPLIDVTAILDSDGAGFRVELEVATGIASESVRVGMPFDVVDRAHEDTDLLGHEIAPELAGILMGQRETGRVTEFPFHGFVAANDARKTVGVFARGLRSYRSSADGTISLTLRRAVEELALSNLTLRSGDAGPAMYVPGARSERAVTHRLGLAILPSATSDARLVEVNEGFQNEQLLATVEGDVGEEARPWCVFSSPLPSTGLMMDSTGSAAVRLYNPSNTDVVLESPLTRRSLRGETLGGSTVVRAHEILTAAVDVSPAPVVSEHGQITVLSPIEDRGGRSRSVPERARLAQLDDRIAHLEAQLSLAAEKVESSSGPDRHRALHGRYVIERELLELTLSRELNDRLLRSTEEVSIPDEADDVIAEIGAALNDLRVKRRIYDYVVQALGPV
jgi:alpha-mannosidase